MAKPIDAKPAVPALQKNPASSEPGHVFRDTVYTSRTLILPSGACVPVIKGQASAVDEEQYQYLNAHPEFERLTE